MAGDWVKFDVDTFEKPEVIKMANDLGIPEEHVAGCLLKVWCWFNKQSRDGHVNSVTEKYIDRVTCVTGFAQAMREVGWLICSDDGLSLPKFDRHNGKSAKSRALAADRKRMERSRSERDVRVTREEERREEKKVKKKSTPHFVKPTVDQVREYTDTRQIKIDPERFVDYYESNGWKVGKNPMKDWMAAVRTWEQRQQSGDADSKPTAITQFPTRKKGDLNDYL